jgi:hypothetical protein
MAKQTKQHKIDGMKYVNTAVPPHKSTIRKNRVTIKDIVHITMRWLALIVLGALALEGAKYLVRGDETVREILAAGAVVLLFYVHLA